MGCQDQRHECRDSRVGIAGACGQCVADYQLGLCKSSDARRGLARIAIDVHGADPLRATSVLLPTTTVWPSSSMPCRHHS